MPAATVAPGAVVAVAPSAAALVPAEGWLDAGADGGAEGVAVTVTVTAGSGAAVFAFGVDAVAWPMKKAAMISTTAPIGAVTFSHPLPPPGSGASSSGGNWFSSPMAVLPLELFGRRAACRRNTGSPWYSKR
ncbi:hypothetical protein GXW82_21810 [Streptacidiphilus sp. 4-A2]|nr:hypothetical protein [Streptacidiphilus sp. 4-A2]